MICNVCGAKLENENGYCRACKQKNELNNKTIFGDVKKTKNGLKWIAGIGIGLVVVAVSVVVLILTCS